MDPNEALAEIRRLIAKISKAEIASPNEQDLAYAVQDLDSWLSKGGFLPSAWERKP